MKASARKKYKTPSIVEVIKEQRLGLVICKQKQRACKTSDKNYVRNQSIEGNSGRGRPRR